MKASVEDLAKNIGRLALENLGHDGVQASEELRARVRELLEDQALIAARAMAGQDVREAQAALNARVKGLKAAGLVMTLGQFQRAVDSAILSVIRGLFMALAS